MKRERKMPEKAPQVFVYRTIGVIHSPHLKPGKGPIQPCYARDVPGTVEVWPEFAQGLQDLQGYSHIYLLYHFHQAKPSPLLAAPFLQNRLRGLFATRLPGRPNAIGLSIVNLLEIEGNVLHVLGIDALDGTPLLDIKPYSHRIDCIVDTRNGWQDEVDDESAMTLGSGKNTE